MSAPAATPAPSRTRPPLWRDVRALRLAFQVVAVVVVGALLAYLYDNLQANQRDLDLPRGYGFLGEPAEFQIAYSDFAPSESVWNALLVGLRNTITVALVGGCDGTVRLGDQLALLAAAYEAEPAALATAALPLVTHLVERGMLLPSSGA